MKKLYLLLFTVILTSCNLNNKNTLPVQIREVEIEENVIDNAIEQELEDIAVGGEGVVFENGGMSFTHESLETAFKQTEAQLNNIKTKYKYESETVKHSAITSMELNLDLFRGEFCCTTHEQKHCEDSKKLKALETKYSCKRFMKKK